MQAQLKEYLLHRILQWTHAAALESGFGELPEQEEADLLARPILYDPRFDLDPDEGPLMIDLLEEDLTTAGQAPHLRRALATHGLEAALIEAETVAEYLAVLSTAMERAGSGGDPVV
jgi:hypothetical protein